MNSEREQPIIPYGDNHHSISDTSALIALFSVYMGEMGDHAPEFLSSDRYLTAKSLSADLLIYGECIGELWDVRAITDNFFEYPSSACPLKWGDLKDFKIVKTFYAYDSSEFTSVLMSQWSRVGDDDPLTVLASTIRNDILTELNPSTIINNVCTCDARYCMSALTCDGGQKVFFVVDPSLCIDSLQMTSGDAHELMLTLNDNVHMIAFYL